MELNSQISWLDYSEYERRKTLDMIDLFREKGTRDELGIGLIRDALANLLFPGTSTVQTRARYFLFIPWMYGDLENRRISIPNRLTRHPTREIPQSHPPPSKDAVRCPGRSRSRI